MSASGHGVGDARASEAVVRANLERELARLEAADPFSAFGLSHDADDRAVRAAFLAATKRLHPNRFARASAPVRTLANEVFLRIKDAYGAIETAEGRDKVLARRGRAPAAPTIGEGSGAVRVGFPSLPRVMLTPARAPSPTLAPPPEPVGPAPPAAAAPSLASIRQQALDRRAEEVRLHHARGCEAQQAGRMDEARDEYRRALDLDSGFQPALDALAGLSSSRFRK